MAALEAEAQAAAEQAEAEGRKHPGVPDDKAQRNFTDTESRIIPAHQVIVAARATNQTSDKQQAAAMMEETIDNVGAVPREVSADAGYYSAKAVDELYALGVDPFVAPEQTRHGRVVPPAPRGRIPSHLSPRDRMRRKLQTRRGRQPLRFADANCGAGIRPDQAGPGIPAVPAAGTGEGERRMVVDLHRPQPAQTVPLWGQSAQKSTGRWASPTHQELLPT